MSLLSKFDALNKARLEFHSHMETLNMDFECESSFTCNTKVSWKGVNHVKDYLVVSLNYDNGHLVLEFHADSLEPTLYWQCAPASHPTVKELQAIQDEVMKHIW